MPPPPPAVVEVIEHLGPAAACGVRARAVRRRVMVDHLAFATASFMYTGAMLDRLLQLLLGRAGKQKPSASLAPDGDRGAADLRQGDLPPTDRQVNYARSLGIENARKMGRRELSEAISKRETRPRDGDGPKPRLGKGAARRGSAKAGKPNNGGATELAHWENFAENIRFMLAIYKRGKSVVVDVLEVNDAFVADNGIIRLDVAAPKRVREHAGWNGSKKVYCTSLEWEQTFELPLTALQHHEPLPDFDPGDEYDNFDGYRRAVERGLKKAHDTI
jgi:hypothetical protein